MIGNKRLSEMVAVVSTIDPQTVAGTEVLGDWVDLGAHESVMFVALTGDLAAETLDFKLQQATSAAGAGAKDLIVGTQLAAHATNNDGKQIILEVRAEQLDYNGGFRFVRPRVIGGGSAGPVAVVGIGANARYGAGDNLASVAEIKRS
jgi:hypothetical protein